MQFDEILVRGYENGKPFKNRVKYSPTMFMATNNVDTPYRSYDGKKLAPKTFDTIKSARKFIEDFGKVDNFQMYGMQNWVSNFIHDEFPGEIQYDDSLIKIGFIDIEADTEGGYPDIMLADKEITAITLRIKNKTLIWGMRDFEPEKGDEFFWFETEEEMLRHFIKVWEKIELDGISGWNTMGFDIPYIVRRITNVLGWEWAKRLSPWKIVKPKKIKSYRGVEIEIFDIYGIIDLDYLPAFKKFRPPSLNPDDNKLDTVAHVVLKEKKLSYAEYGSLNRLYKENPQKFFEYNVKDAKLVQRLEESLNIIRLLFNMAYSAKINVHECFMPTRLWDSIIYGFLMNKKIVVPVTKLEESDDETFEGAYVKVPNPALYKWVVSFDATSLYPSLFMHYNIGPDSLRGKLDVNHHSLLSDAPHGHEAYLKENNLSMAANGALYTRDQPSFLTEIIQFYFDKRQHYKDLMKDAKKLAQAAKNKADKTLHEGKAQIYDIYQQNYKISLNALYGANGNKGFRFYNLVHAEATTLSGQLTIKWAEKYLNAYLNKIMQTEGEDYCIGSDTDSLYMNFDPLVKKFNVPEHQALDFLDKFAREKIQPQMDAIFDKLSKKMNSYQQKLNMKREKISDKVVWVAKKRYFQRVLDNEGVRYAEPKIEVTGLESVRTTNPEFCRNKLKEAYEIIMSKDEDYMHDFIRKVEEEFYTLPFDEIACPKGCKNLRKYGDNTYIYTRQKGVGVPIQVRGALLYNHWLNKLNLDSSYETIMEGEKIRYCYLKLPNPIGENVVSTPRILPKEMGLDEYIDYETQFEKVFMDPLRTILHIIGWNERKVTTLESLFS